MKKILSLSLILLLIFSFAHADELFRNSITYIRYGEVDGKPLVWRLLSSSEDESLFICNEAIASMKMHSKQADFVSYDKSDLYKYIKEELYNKAFFDEEKAKILEFDLPSRDLLKDANLGFKTDRDRIFKIANQGDKHADGIWLSTPAKSNPHYMLRTKANGIIGYSGVESVLGVLPILRLSNKDVKIELGDGTEASPYVLNVSLPGLMKKEAEKSAELKKQLEEKQKAEKEALEKEEKRKAELEKITAEIEALKNGEKTEDYDKKLKELTDKKNSLELVRIEGFPELNFQGFMNEGEFVDIRPEQGIWRFCNKDTRIEIKQYKTKNADKKNVTYYVADIYVRDGSEGLVVTPSQEDWPSSVHKAKTVKQSELQKRHDFVFAMNTDYYIYRTDRKDAKVHCGVEIRNGKIIVNDPIQKERSTFPPYHHLMIMEDGSFEFAMPNELTAEQMLEKGVKHAFTFGPILVKNGEVQRDYKEKYGYYDNCRSAIGYVEKGHYVAIASEGKLRDSSGLTLIETAEILKKMGAVQAFNMDGGQTAFMGFMGKQLNRVYARTDPYSTRPQCEILGFGRTNYMKEGK